MDYDFAERFRELIRFQSSLQYLQHPGRIQAFIHEFTVIFKDCIISTIRPVKRRIIYLLSKCLKSNRLLITEIILGLYCINTNL